MGPEEEERVHRALKKLSSNIDDLYQAKNFVNEGKYERALDLFRKALTGSIGPLEDLELKDSLAKLVKNYPAAIDTLSAIRDKHEQRMQVGSSPPSPRVYDEWNILNEVLGEEYRELQLIEQIQASSDKFLDVSIITLIRHNFNKYLRDKRYEVIEPYLNQIGNVFLVTHSLLEAELLFPIRQKYREDILADDTERTRREGALIFEACLGLKQYSRAMLLANKILDVVSNVPTYVSLLNAAKRAGTEKEKKLLLKRAKEELSEAGFKELMDSID